MENLINDKISLILKKLQSRLDDNFEDSWYYEFDSENSREYVTYLEDDCLKLKIEKTLTSLESFYRIYLTYIPDQSEMIFNERELSFHSLEIADYLFHSVKELFVCTIVDEIFEKSSLGSFLKIN